jgi:acetolactate synthase-1/2/3 large subunit
MMNIQEMATAAENNLDVKIILMNNEALGLVHQQQSLFYKQGVFAATYPGMINFMQIAAGFGLQTCDLNNEADPHAALQAIIARPVRRSSMCVSTPKKKCIRWCRRVRQILKWWGNKPCNRQFLTTSFLNSPYVTIRG